jgi:hypothetical protein
MLLLQRAEFSEQRANAIVEVVKAASSEKDDLRETIKRIIAVAYKSLHCDRVTLFLCDHAKRTLWCVISKDSEGFKMPFGKGIVGHVADTGNELIIRDCYEHELFNPEVDKLTKYKTRSMIALPVFDADNNVIAVIQAINKYWRAGKEALEGPEDSNMTFMPFTNDDISILRDMCRDIGRSLRQKAKDALQSDVMKVLTKVHQMRKMDRASQVVKSLVEAYSSDTYSRAAALLPKLSDFCYQFLAIGKFKAILTRIRFKHREVRRRQSLGMDIAGLVNMKASEFVALETGTPKKKSSDVDRYASLRNLRLRGSMEISAETICTFDSWEFDPWSVTIGQSVALCTNAFVTIGIVKHFRLDFDKLQNCIAKLQASYYDTNAYHNWHHALHVFQQAAIFVRQTDARVYLRKIDILSLLVAALAHDVDHPGADNFFQINKQTELALLYNDQSVLEQHHASFTFRMMQDEDCGILGSLSFKAREDARKTIVSAILSTDMKSHFEQVSSLRERMVTAQGKGGDSPQIFDVKNEADRKLLVGGLLHACDLGAQTTPLEVAEVWGEKIIAEFRSQGE